jgi:hypothetical protein
MSPSPRAFSLAPLALTPIERERERALAGVSVLLKSTSTCASSSSAHSYARSAVRVGQMSELRL